MSVKIMILLRSKQCKKISITAGVDAFFQSWQNENCLLVPPVTLVCETLKHMDRDSAVGTLVIPDCCHVLCTAMCSHVLH